MFKFLILGVIGAYLVSVMQGKGPLYNLGEHVLWQAKEAIITARAWNDSMPDHQYWEYQVNGGLAWIQESLLRPIA